MCLREPDFYGIKFKETNIVLRRLTATLFLFSQGICRNHGVIKLCFRHVSCKVMDGFSGNAGIFGDGVEVCIGKITQLCQGDGKSYGDAEILNLFEFLLLYTLQTKLYQSTEGYTISVGSAVTA